MGKAEDRPYKRVESIKINKIQFEITAEVVDKLMSLRQMTGNEDCGILLGSVVGNMHYRINEVSGSCRIENKASTHSCIRDFQKANMVIEHEFETSAHTRIYFGEWHTHPEDNPRSSSRDELSIKELVLLTELDATVTGLILAIVGRKCIYWRRFTIRIRAD